LGEYRRAIEYHEQHLAMAREIGDREGEGHALGNLGNAYHRLGEYRRAIEYYEQQLAIAREIGDRFGEGNALWNMSLALDKLGQRAEAIARAQEALQILDRIESPTADQVRTQLEEWHK
jgi:tetratricopeptide (TPR) repeat protein